jgi:hypothetical protein
MTSCVGEGGPLDLGSGYIALLRVDVDAVIVIAGGYSDEVARIVRATYRADIDVAIWRESGLETA